MLGVSETCAGGACSMRSGSGSDSGSGSGSGDNATSVVEQSWIASACVVDLLALFVAS